MEAKMDIKATLASIENAKAKAEEVSAKIIELESGEIQKLRDELNGWKLVESNARDELLTHMHDSGIERVRGENSMAVLTRRKDIKVVEEQEVKNWLKETNNYDTYTKVTLDLVGIKMLAKEAAIPGVSVTEVESITIKKNEAKNETD